MGGWGGCHNDYNANLSFQLNLHSPGQLELSLAITESFLAVKVFLQNPSYLKDFSSLNWFLFKEKQSEFEPTVDEFYKKNWHYLPNYQKVLAFLQLCSWLSSLPLWPFWLLSRPFCFLVYYDGLKIHRNFWVEIKKLKFAKNHVGEIFEQPCSWLLLWWPCRPPW